MGRRQTRFFFILGALLFFLLGFGLVTLSSYLEKEGFTTTEKCTAVIVEPREHKALSFVIENALENLPENWDVIIMHGNTNKDFVLDILDKDLSDYKDRITTKNLPVDNLTIPEYNRLLTSTEFYDNIPTEIFLIFQTDSVICNENRQLLGDFMEYDYVGAPWKDAVGNGGFSLRRKSKALETLSQCKYNGENEDVYFANPCIDISKPSLEQAKFFSTEAIYSETSFGVHKPWAYLNETEMENKIQKCSPLKKLWALNKQI